jgi:uncharacterized protein DUF6582
MATTKQKTAARKNIVKARKAQSTRAGAKKATTKNATTKNASSRATGLSTADKNNLPSTQFAFPKERKEPLTDAEHVRNAVARFDQVEDVSDAERDRAWKRIRAAAKKFDVELSEKSWRELFKGEKARKR